MYLCICNAVRESDTEKHHLIGTKCGKCISSNKAIQPNVNYTLQKK